MPINLEILAYEDTPLGPLCLRRRELLSSPGKMVTEVTLNHEFLMSSVNTDSERVISNRAVEIHQGDRLRALVGGLGLGYTTQQLLRNPMVADVEVVEYLPQVVEWMRSGLIPLSDELNGNSELKVAAGDVYARLASAPTLERFDLIVIDVDHSPADQLGTEHPFYTEAGLRQAAGHLAPNGVLAVWSYAEDSAFSAALQSVFDKVHVEPVTTFNAMVDHQQTDWLFFATSRLDT